MGFDDGGRAMKTGLGGGGKVLEIGRRSRRAGGSTFRGQMMGVGQRGQCECARCDAIGPPLASSQAWYW